MNATLLADTRNTLGESCFWDPRDNCLWWTDIHNCQVFRLDMENRVTHFDLPDRACFIRPRKQAGFVIGFPKRVVISNQDLTSFATLHEVEPSLSETRINDATVDPFGGVIFGTFHEPADRANRQPLAGLYRLKPDGTLVQLLNKIVVSNGLDFSPDGRIMYFTDTHDGVIRRFSIEGDFDQFTEISPLAGSDIAPGAPDGGYVDEKGNYWSARVWAGCIVRITKEGKIDAKINLPTRGPTCLTIGGASNRQIFITSLRMRLTDEELADYPHAGGIFTADSDIGASKPRLAAL